MNSGDFIHDLSNNNTLALRSRASNLYILENSEQLTEASELAKSTENVFILGGGSNVVLMPNINALIIKVATKGIKLIKETKNSFYVQVMAGENWHKFVKHSIENSWYGLENLALIPGTVGAAPVQNIGAYGVEISELIHSVQVFDLDSAKHLDFDKESCQFSYRNSIFKQNPGKNKWLITSVTFKLPKVWHPNITYPDLQKSEIIKTNIDNLKAEHVFNAVIKIRQQKLPNPDELPNAGSFFQNPIVSAEKHHALKQKYPDIAAFKLNGSYKIAAAWLIQHCGFKGNKIGPVGMHANQALVMVNYENATANDVIKLANLIKQDVFNTFGIELQQEPVLVS